MTFRYSIPSDCHCCHMCNQCFCFRHTFLCQMFCEWNHLPLNCTLICSFYIYLNINLLHITFRHLTLFHLIHRHCIRLSCSLFCHRLNCRFQFLKPMFLFCHQVPYIHILWSVCFSYFLHLHSVQLPL